MAPYSKLIWEDVINPNPKPRQTVTVSIAPDASLKPWERGYKSVQI